MKKEPISGRTAGIAFLIIGLAVIALAAFIQKSDRDFYTTASVAKGQVTKTRLKEDNATNQKLRVYYSFEVDGVEYQNFDYSGVGNFAEGDLVDVLYTPDNPERSELAADREGPPWLFYIVGVLCTLIGIFGVRQRPATGDTRSESL